MENKIYTVTKQEWNERKKVGFGDGSLMIKINGKKINIWEEYAEHIETEMKFPTSCKNSYDVYLDWIQDLSWLGSIEDIYIVIDNYNYFMKKDEDLKKQIITDFEDIILPWWGKEVVECVMEGKAKKFNVYLII